MKRSPARTPRPLAHRKRRRPMLRQQLRWWREVYFAPRRQAPGDKSHQRAKERNK